MAVKNWQAFAHAAPDLAQAGLRLLYQGADTAAGFLATVAPDQGPRVHPVFPVVAVDNLWLFIVNLSPKYRDLRRNGLFALHSMPTPEGGEEFYIRGQATEITDPGITGSVVDATHQRQGGSDIEALFQCQLGSVLYTKWSNWGTAQAWPDYAKWAA